MAIGEDQSYDAAFLIYSYKLPCILSGMRTLVVVLILIGSTAVCAQNSPSLKETFEWMHSAFPESRSASESRLNETRELNFVDGKNGASPSCTITIVEHWKADDKPVTKDTTIDLSLIDPDSIKAYVDDVLDKNSGELTMVATDDKKIIIERIENRENDKPSLSERIFISFIVPDYAARFAKAFKNAVVLCGGKRSTF
jgi:hypothetical protein